MSPRRESDGISRSAALGPLLVVCGLLVAACGGGGSAGQPTAVEDAASAGGDRGEDSGDAGDMGHGDGSGTGHDMTMLGQGSWQDMTMKLTAAKPARFVIFQGADQTREVTPKPDDSMHLMVVLEDAKSGMRIPYSTVWVTVTDQAGRAVVDKRAWPMIARGMGNHYGVNVALPSHGSYEAQVQVGPPQVARHAGLRDAWREQHVFAVSFDWTGQL